MSNSTCNEIALDSDNSDDDSDGDGDNGGDGARTKSQKKPAHRYNTRSQPKTTVEQSSEETQEEFEFNGTGTEYNESGSNKKTNQNKRKRRAKQLSAEPQRRSGRLSKQGDTNCTKFFSGKDNESDPPLPKRKKKSAMEALLDGAKCDTAEELKEDTESPEWQCGYEGCITTARGMNNKGVRACQIHGAKAPLCTVGGCKNQSRNGGTHAKGGALDEIMGELCPEDAATMRRLAADDYDEDD